MYKILDKTQLAANIFRLQVEAPFIAGKHRPGQFVMIRVDEKGERIPLTVACADPKAGAITIIFQVAGRTTEKLSALNRNEYISDVAGPLGHPTEVKKFGTVVCIGGGLGIALIFPLIKAMKEAGNKVISVISAKNKDLLILADEIKKFSDEVKIATDDGSLGYRGFPTDVLNTVIKSGEHIDLVLAVGPIPLMAAISEVTRPCGIKTVVSLNSIMVDGTGMCGGCRVSVGGQTKFACVDGPEFDGHKVDFKELAGRMRIYEKEEKASCKPVLGEKVHQGICQAAVKPAVNGNVPRQEIAEQPSAIRRTNFHEVAFGFTPDQARLEAGRCLQCKKPKCQEGCPVRINIPVFIGHIQKGEYAKAIRVIKESSCLPAVCGRVCPCEDNCEKGCILGNKGEPVAVGALERFASDMETVSGKIEFPAIADKKGVKVAVVGSGPAGISCAGDLAKMGYEVALFEIFHKAGGVLIYGIPEFRLPKAIVDREIEYLKAIGVEIKLNNAIGKLFTIDELFTQGYKAVFAATGAGLPVFLGLPGENLNGIMSANEFLTRSNLMKAYAPSYETPILRKDKVVVIGGGNVAMDAARTAIRLGAKEVTVVYRRSREELPARPIEAEHGEKEGLKFIFLAAPAAFNGGPDNWVREIRCQRMRLGEPDRSGRRRPVVIPGEEFILEAEEVIIAIGNGPHPLVPQTTPDLKIDEWGNIVACEATGKTSKKGFFAGGDIVTGSATVISAMGAGRRAAKAMDEYVNHELKKNEIGQGARDLAGNKI